MVHNYPRGPLGVSTVPSRTSKCPRLGQWAPRGEIKGVSTWRAQASPKWGATVGSAQGRQV